MSESDKLLAEAADKYVTLIRAASSHDKAVRHLRMFGVQYGLAKILDIGKALNEVFATLDAKERAKERRVGRA